MTLDSGVSVGQLLLAVAAVLLSGGVAWGGLLARVRSLEGEVAALSDMGERMARVETKLDGLTEQLRELNRSVQWMREPASYDGAKGTGR